MFVTQPKLVLRRTVAIRVLLCLFVLPLGLLAAWLAVLAWNETPRMPWASGVCAVLAALFLGGFAWLFQRETKRRVRIHDEGIVQEVGARTTELRWAEVREIWFEAMRIQAGGLIGAAIGAAVRAASKKRDRLNANTTTIKVRLVGDDARRIVLTSNDKGVVGAFEEVIGQVNPGLLEEAVRVVQQGQSAAFGPVSVSSRGIARGAREPVPYGEIESFAIKGGKVRLKKRGAWLDALAIPVKKIPNVLVLVDLFHRLSTKGDAPTGPGSNLASTGYF